LQAADPGARHSSTQSLHNTQLYNKKLALTTPTVLRRPFMLHASVKEIIVTKGIL
jgi:hypothetical protein